MKVKEMLVKFIAVDNKEQIDDLGVLVQHKRYKWNPTYNERINSLLNGVQSYNEGIVREELFKQRVVETDLWAEQFSKYLPEDFNDRYAVFTRDRNHIMHNKLIDRVAWINGYHTAFLWN